ncbi:stage V sporulation protein AC [Clostridium cellulovorans]|uniref:Stage V sporulation protein AC n=1 Tax=Clostridium cellulovorans (strain ATCC 35296 / DSM 3052 / OCM 3 / 743B) TaxID=573061 RepID=D9SMY2_CLOC7|nr:stage V sporulation protein AC [Clostridium cellulovorans]ADL51848.1 stage V sporulation protein AC [Clostridium cellulovorans 743B]
MDAKERKLKAKFDKISEQNTPKPKIIQNCFFAFIVGGAICTVGQFINEICISLDISKENTSAITAIIMVFIGALFTGLGVYDKLASKAGAGSVVPITGFANSIVAPAMEFKKEGFVFGVAAKMFTIAGPVLVYGITTSVIVGLGYYFIK